MTFDVDHVFDALTTNEKISLLSGDDFWHTVAFPGKIPAIRVSDGPNGIRGTKFFAGVPAACIPCGTALGATWDTKLLQSAGELLGKEALAKGAACWLGPTMNIQRSPLGGRGFESFAEDPHLSGIVARALILGCQSTGVVPTPKHFVCNDQEDERQALDTIVTPRAMREIYLRPFQIVARDCKPGALMTAYNKVNSRHASESPDLLNGIVRQEWGWNPLMMSDWYGTYSCVDALNAGLDLEMPGKSRHRGPFADSALSSRKITLSTIDARARKVLEFVRQASEAPTSDTEGVRDLPEDRELNRRLGAASIVLLKNDDDVLPLPKTLRKIALIGSHVKNPAISGGGSASLEPYYTVSLFDAIAARMGPGVDIRYEVGMYGHKILPVIDRHLQAADGTPTGKIRFFNQPVSDPGRTCVGQEPLKQTFFQLMDYNKSPELNFALFYASMEGDFIPDETGIWDFGCTVCGTANVYLDDELVIENSHDQKPGDSFFGNGTAEKYGSKSLKAGQTYKLRIEFGSSATSDLRHQGMVPFGGGGARLGACLRIVPEEAISKAVALAKECEHVILCTGLNASRGSIEKLSKLTTLLQGDWESEGFDRKHMDLPPGVDELILRVLQANPRTVVVNQSGTPVTMAWAPKAKAIVQAWYGGNETGASIADILFGDVNPSGKLPLSWPARVEDNPSYLNFGSVQGRVLYGEDCFVGYRYYDKMKPPQFSFGYGLSYTTFALSDLSVTWDKATLSVENTGQRAGAEVVQLYIAAPESAVHRPLKELHGFTKVFLESGQKERVEVAIDKYATSFWDELESKWLNEAGRYQVLVGTSSAETTLVGELRLETSRYWLGL